MSPKMLLQERARIGMEILSKRPPVTLEEARAPVYQKDKVVDVKKKAAIEKVNDKTDADFYKAEANWRKALADLAKAVDDLIKADASKKKADDDCSQAAVRKHFLDKKYNKKSTGIRLY